MSDLRSDLCKKCIHTKVCMKDKNVCGDVFVPGNPLIFDNNKLWTEYEERKAKGFPCVDFADENIVPKWIPVTEQPKPGQYLVHKLYDHGYGEYHSYDILTFTDNLNKVDKYDFHGKEYKRPGWFDYDSEYGHFECGDNITHYMPLPAPPKEET